MAQEERKLGELIMDSRSPRARIKRTLSQWIESGKLPKGEAIPSEQMLAGYFDASRVTVRSVLKELEHDGVLVLRNRRRVVAEGAQPRVNPLVSQTVISLADLPDRRFDEFSTGHLVYVQIGVSQALSRLGVNYLAMDPDGVGSEQIEQIANSHPYGVVGYRDKALPSVSLDRAALFKRLGVPMVLYGYDDELESYDTVYSDQESGTYDLTRFLIDRGCRRILRFWEISIDQPQYFNWLKLRDKGYERAIEEAGLEVLPALYSKDLPFLLDTSDKYHMKARYNTWVLGEALKADPGIDAIMAISEGAMCNVATSCRLIGRRPGEDITVVGYDNSFDKTVERRWEPYIPPASIDKCNYEIGTELVTLLMDRVSGRLEPGPCHRKVRPKLVTLPT